ncbi:MAG TPA: CbtB domain-containing protein [Methyloceanibacter sp.]|nr:CbtB domain-containing protein [Methyloceanibacter sp.]
MMSILPTESAGGADNAATTLTISRVIPIFAAALLGIFIVGGVGFSHIEAVHNAAHDYRHSMSFPCH